MLAKREEMPKKRKYKVCICTNTGMIMRKYVEPFCRGLFPRAPAAERVKNHRASVAPAEKNLETREKYTFKIWKILASSVLDQNNVDLFPYIYL